MAAAARQAETVAREAVAKRNKTQNNNNTSTNIPLYPPPYTTFHRPPCHAPQYRLAP